MAIVYRDEQGFDLSPAQVDNNFRELEARVVSLEENPTPANDIVNVTQSASGSQLTIYLRDGSFYTTSLPVAIIRFRGKWLASTAYFRNDLVRYGRSIYLVLEDHLSDTTFSDEAVDASDNELYESVFEPTNPEPQDVTDSEITIGEDYFDSYLRCTHAFGCVVTILDELDVPVPTGTEITFRQGDTGGITFAYNDDIITLNGIEGCQNATDRRGAWIMIKNVGNNVWDVTGLLAAEEVVVEESTS